MLMISLLHCNEGVPPAGIDEKPMQQFSEWMYGNPFECNLSWRIGNPHSVDLRIVPTHSSLNIAAMFHGILDDLIRRLVSSVGSLFREHI